MPGKKTAQSSPADVATSLAEIEQRLAAVERAIAGRAPNTTPEWAAPRWYENSVQLALGKLLRFGDLAFDVGANIGVISAMMGAAVGPYGRIVAFEASPRTIGQLHINLNHSNAFNVTVMHAAVADRSGDFLPVFYGSETPADSIFTADERDPDAFVTSIALDDYVERLGAAPRVVKIDIEGAELLALQGFRATLAKHRPAIVIETLSTELRVGELLQSLGYDLCVDLSDMTPYDPSAAAERHVCNLLFMHKHEDRGEVFRSSNRTQVAEYAARDIMPRADESYIDLGNLAPGVYVLHFDFSPTAADIHETLELAVGSAGPLHSLHIAPIWHLALVCRSIPFELRRQTPAFVLFKRATPETVRSALPTIRLERLDA